MESRIGCSETDDRPLQSALNGTLNPGASGLKAFTSMGYGLAGIVVKDGGGKTGDVALLLADLCGNCGFEAEREVVKPLGRSMQQCGHSSFGSADGQSRQPLSRLEQLKAGGAVEAADEILDPLGNLVLGCGNQFGGGGRGGCAQVGDKIGDGEIGFMTDGGNDRQARSGNCARHTLAVEGGQVLERSAAAGQDDDIDSTGMNVPRVNESLSIELGNGGFDFGWRGIALNGDRKDKDV